MLQSCTISRINWLVSFPPEQERCQHDCTHTQRETRGKCYHRRPENCNRSVMSGQGIVFLCEVSQWEEPRGIIMTIFFDRHTDHIECCVHNWEPQGYPPRNGSIFVSENNSAEQNVQRLSVRDDQHFLPPMLDTDIGEGWPHAVAQMLQALCTSRVVVFAGGLCRHELGILVGLFLFEVLQPVSFQNSLLGMCRARMRVGSEGDCEDKEGAVVSWSPAWS